MRVTRVAGRLRPRPEVHVEFASGSALLHQIISLRVDSLLCASRAELHALARALLSLEPSTLGLVPESVLVDLLSALSAAHATGHATVHSPAASVPPMPPPPPTSPPQLASHYAAVHPPAAHPPSVTAVLHGIGDLQRAMPAALQAAKSKMELVFEAHRIAAGDEGFEYDKRRVFTPAEDSGWD